MKSIVSMLICVILMMSLASCGTNPADSLESAMNAYADFRADLEDEEIVAVNARIVTVSDGKKALVTDIKNNTANQEAITEVEVAFAAWDVEGNPVAIKTEENPNHSSNVIKAAVNDITVPGGETWTANKGLFLSAECKHIAYVTAIAITCKIGETRWENPIYDAWQETYTGLALESWQMADMVNYLDGDTSAEEATADGETHAELTFTSFYENLLFQDIVAIKATANLQDDGRNALMTNIRNASRARTSEITVAFAIWDEAGEPLMIKSASGLSKDSFIKEVGMGELVIDGGKIWDADMGLVVTNARKSISHVEAIVVSCKFGDTQWNNPLYDTWCTYFSGKQLDDTMMTTLASFAETVK